MAKAQLVVLPGTDGQWPVLGCPNCPFAHASAILQGAVRYDCILGERHHLGATRPQTPPDFCPLREDGEVEVFLALQEVLLPRPNGAP